MRYTGIKMYLLNISIEPYLYRKGKRYFYITFRCLITLGFKYEI